MNLENWQTSVAKIIQEFSNAGRFVVQLNAHRWFQVSAVSPQRSEVVIVERATLAENANTRTRMLDDMVAFLTHINIDPKSVDFVVDGLSNSKIYNIGTDQHPILSTGSKHLKKRLLQFFEAVHIIEKSSRMPKFTAEAYKVVRERCRVVTSEVFNKRCIRYLVYKDILLSPCDLGQIGDDLSKIFSEQLMVKFYPNQQRRDDMRELYQNALNAIQLVAAIDADNKENFIKYSKAFLTLFNTANNQCQYMPIANQHNDAKELTSTIDRLCKLAETEDWFSLTYFNIILDYHISDIEFTAKSLTNNTMLPEKLFYCNYEPINFGKKLKIRAVLNANHYLTINEAIKQSDMKN